jgi:hypothetical protein
MWMKHPEMAKEFAAATPKNKKLPYHVKKKKAEVRGVVEGLTGGK